MSFISQIITNNNSVVSINGKVYVGNNVSITSGGRVVIDGVVQDGESLVSPVNIKVDGNVDKIDLSAGTVEVKGSCGSVKTQSGDVNCWDISDYVNTMSGNVTAKTINGHVNTVSGNIMFKA